MIKINVFSKLFSYLAPITIESQSSQVNPELKIVLFQGKLILDADKANYSFGELHKVFQKSFAELDIKSKPIDEVLILGFGCGSVASILHKELKINCNITGIELDKKVIELGQKYFPEIFTDSKIQIINDSAENLTLFPDKHFDLVVMDVYEDISVPEFLETEKHLSEVVRILKPGGLYVFNKVLSNYKDAAMFKGFKEQFESKFGKVDYVNIRGINSVLAGTKTRSN